MIGDLDPAEALRIQGLTRKRFARLWQSLRRTNPRAAGRALKARCKTDRVLFARYFFAEKLADQDGDRIPFSRAHRDALTSPKLGYRERSDGRGWRRARMLPRGNGKTTVYLRVELCHDIVYELERYIVVMAESAMLARTRVYEIALELEGNRRLREYFGDLVGKDLWQRGAGQLLTSNDVTILAKSMASQVRGLLHPVTNNRPTKIVLDDAENSADVLNPVLRERDKRRYTQDIEGAAAVDGSTSIQITGTPLHRQALLMSFRDNPAWDFRAYPAIKSWPERADLWEKCRQLFVAAGAPDPDADPDEVNPSAVEVAKRFYLAHKKEMDRGVQVLWPEQEPIFRLMVWRWMNGDSAFFKEKQLEPRDPTLSTFDMDRAVRNELHGDHILVFQPQEPQPRRVLLSECRIVCFHDPCGADPHAKRTQASLGDYAAIVTMALERAPGAGWFGHVINAWMSQRAPVSQQIKASFEIGERFKPERYVFEADTYDLIRAEYQRERERRKRAGLWHQLPLRELEHQSQSKRARIATMEPAITNGWITFERSVPMPYWNQFVDDPTADHDDGPDATEGCWRCGRIHASRLRLVSPKLV